MKKFLQGFLAGIVFFAALFVIVNYVMEFKKNNKAVSLNN